MPSLTDYEAEMHRNIDSESLVVRGTVVAPALNAAIATLAAPPVGVYEIIVIARYGTVSDVTDGMDFRIGGTLQFTLPVPAIVNSVGIPIRVVRKVSGIQNIQVSARVAGAASSEYIAHIVATKIGEV